MAKTGIKFNRYKIQNIYRSKVIGAVTSALLLFVTISAEAQTLVDRVVAVVDGEPILMSEVNTKVKSGPLVLISDFPANEKSEPFTRALQDSINFKLMKAAAEDLGIEITEAEIDSQIEKILKNQKASRSQLNKFLKEQGKSYSDYREDFRNQLLLRRFQGRAIMPLVKVSEEQIRSYYLEKSGKSAEIVTFDIKQILIPMDSGASEKVKKAKAEVAKEAYDKVNGGMDFDAAAKIYSQNGKATLMKGVKVKDLAHQIKTAVKFLEKGQSSEPIKTPMGYHLFYVNKKDFAGDSKYLKNKRQLEFELRNREITSQLKIWLDSERQKRKVDIIR
jgi:peptidyl-prolyl cis-trans isomerase SurA